MKKSISNDTSAIAFLQTKSRSSISIMKRSSHISHIIKSAHQYLERFQRKHFLHSKPETVRSIIMTRNTKLARKLSQALIIIAAIVTLADVPVTIAEVANHSDEISLNVGTDGSYNVSYYLCPIHIVTSEYSIANTSLRFQNIFRICT